MTPQTLGLALLVIAMVVTRPWEERRWRAGRLSDEASARLVVARLPFLAIGFGLLTGMSPAWLVVAGVVGAVAGILLYPVAVRRLRRFTLRNRG